jgi:hypothetical protein
MTMFDKCLLLTASRLLLVRRWKRVCPTLSSATRQHLVGHALDDRAIIDAGSHSGKERIVADRIRTIKVQADIIGPIWFIGWLFTLAYANLGFWQAVFAIVIWPFYLGNAVG